jgi:hypothetical protein
MAKFGINSMGEAYRGDECLVSSVIPNEVAAKALTPKEYRSYLRGRDTNTKSPLYRKMRRAIDKEFDRLAREAMTDKEFALYKAVMKLQKLNDARFRVEGGIRANGRQAIILSTEFVNFTDQKQFWKELRQFARETGAKVSTMLEGEHLDKYSPPRGVEGERVLTDEPCRYNGGTPWAVGPNHGRPERQVTVDWDVTGKSLAELRLLRGKLAKASEKLWRWAGVGVI